MLWQASYPKSVCMQVWTSDHPRCKFLAPYLFTPVLFGTCSFANLNFLYHVTVAGRLMTRWSWHWIPCYLAFWPALLEILSHSELPKEQLIVCQRNYQSVWKTVTKVNSQHNTISGVAWVIGARGGLQFRRPQKVVKMPDAPSLITRILPLSPKFCRPLLSAPSRYATECCMSRLGWLGGAAVWRRTRDRLPSLRGRWIEYQPAWPRVRWGAFTCVGWQVRSLCDPIKWCPVALRWGFHEELCRPLPFYVMSCFQFPFVWSQSSSSHSE